MKTIARNLDGQTTETFSEIIKGIAVVIIISHPGDEGCVLPMPCQHLGHQLRSDIAELGIRAVGKHIVAFPLEDTDPEFAVVESVDGQSMTRRRLNTARTKAPVNLKTGMPVDHGIGGGKHIFSVSTPFIALGRDPAAGTIPVGTHMRLESVIKHVQCMSLCRLVEQGVGSQRLRGLESQETMRGMMEDQVHIGIEKTQTGEDVLILQSGEPGTFDGRIGACTVDQFQVKLLLGTQVTCIPSDSVGQGPEGLEPFAIIMTNNFFGWRRQHGFVLNGFQLITLGLYGSQNKCQDKKRMVDQRP